MTLLRLGTKDIISIEDLSDLPGRFTNTLKKQLIKAIESPNETLEKLKEQFDAHDEGQGSYIDDALIAAYLGDPELALKNIERFYELDGLGHLYIIWGPLFDEVRQISQFNDFARKIGLVDYWIEFGWPDLCHPVGDDDFVCD